MAPRAETRRSGGLRRCKDVLAVHRRDGFVDAIDFHPAPLSETQFGYDLRDRRDVEEWRDAPGQVLIRLVDLPVAARLSTLRLECPIQAEGNHGCWGAHDVFLERLLARDRPRLRALELDARMLPASAPGEGPALSSLLYGQMHAAEVRVGKLDALWARAPRLERLVVAQPSAVSLGKIDAPKLRALVFGSSADRCIKAIAEGRVPSLEVLRVRVKSPAQVKALLANRTLRRLRHLCLAGRPSKGEGDRRGDAMLKALVASPRVFELETLDLGGWDASDRGWKLLLDAAPKFERLKSLRLSTWRIDPSVADTDDWMEEAVECLRSPHFALRERAMGKRLEEAFPVRWLTTSLFTLEDGPPAGAYAGFCPWTIGAWDGFAEQRT